MVRNPSIHIKYSDVVEFFKERFGESTYVLADEFALFAKNRVPAGRIIFKATEKQKKDIERLLSSSVSDVEHFNRMLSGVRELHSHRDFKHINQESREYLLLKDVTSIAVEFCETFELEKGVGFRLFIETGLVLMNKNYGINKFKTYREKIFNRFSHIQVVKLDKRTEETLLLYSEWEAETAKETGHILSMVNNVDKYFHFVHAREDADEMEANYNDWIKAQFWGMRWTGGIPELSQLHGEPAKERFVKFKIELDKKIKEFNLEGKIDKIKQYREEIWKM